MANTARRFGNRDDKRTGSGRGRARVSLRPVLETLEERLVPTMTVSFAGAATATGSGSVDVESNAVYNDASGNVYITGSFQGTVDFDPSGGVTNLTATGGRDSFLAKYSNTGALVWAKDIRGADSTGIAQGSAIVVDSSGNVFVTGTFTGTFNFDPNSGTTNLSAPSRNDAYIAKYSSTGTLSWAKSVVGSGSSFDQGYALAVDSAGNVAVGGTFQSTATFGSSSYSAGGSSDSFVSKLDTNGNFLWTRVTAGTGSSLAQTSGLAFDASNNLILTGFYSGTVDFDPTSSVDQLPVYGSRDIFVQKFDASGNLVWVEGVGGTDIDQGNGVAADSSGNIYVTGTFSSTADFDPSSSTVNLTAGGFEDAFLLKLNSSGSYVWAKDLSTTGYNAAQGTGVGIDGGGHLFVAGYYQGTMTLATSQTLTSAGSYDVFVGEYDTAGNFIAAQSDGGSNFDSDYGVGVNATGQVAIAGRYTGPATFGTVTLPSQTNKSIFFAEISTGSTVIPNPPVAPSAPTLQSSSDSGTSNTDNITNVTSPVFNITGAVAGNTVQLLRDGTVVATRSGPGAITDPGPVTNGNHVYTAIQIDTYNQSSPASATTTVTFDTVAPAAPSAPTLNSADDSGTVGDGITNVKQPRLTGTAAAGSTVQLLNASNSVLGTATADPTTGAYSVKPSSNLADGVYVFHVTATDVAGNTSTASATLTVTIDSTAPAAPSTPTLYSADDSGTVGDGVTNVKQPRLTGTAQANSTVQLLDASNNVLATATAAPTTGAYTLKPSTNLSDGTYVVHVQATDAAGNVSPASGTLTLTIDTVAPAAPTQPTLLAADDSGTVGDNLTNVVQPRLTGTASGAASVQLINAGGTVIGSATVTNNSYTVAPGTSLPQGASTIRVQAIDVAGNISAASASLTITIDSIAPATPAAPTLLAADDSGVVGDGITNVTQPRFTGTVEANATVWLTAANVVIGTATAGADGSYTVKPSSPITNLISAIRVQAVDAAGNASAASPSFTLYVDTTPPAAPSTPALLASDDSGTVGDGITSVRQPTLTGTGETNSTVTLLDANNNVLGTGTATGGSYSIKITTSLADGTYAIRARATDVAGNVGTASSAFSLTIYNSTPLPATPSTPTLLAADDSGALGDNITNINKPRLTGTATAGTTVQIINSGGTVLGSAIVAGTGTYTVAFTNAIPDGSITVMTRILDANSNPSNNSGSLTLTIDTTAPVAPTALSIVSADDTGQKGDNITANNQPRIASTGEAGTTVTLVNGSGGVLATGVVPQNGVINLAPSSPLADGVVSLRLKLTDAAGNVSGYSGTLNITIDTTAPSAPTVPVLYASDDSGTVGDGLTNVSQPRLSTTAESGSSVTFSTDSGTILATGTVGNSGSITIQIGQPLADGTYHVRAVSVDAAGNVSQFSPLFNLTILSAPPPTPLAPLLNPADDTGILGDSKTANRQPRFVGTTLAGLTVDLLNNGNSVIATTTAAADGSFTLQPSGNLAVGSYNLSIRVRNAAGTASVSSGLVSLSIIDATPGDFNGDGKSDFAVFRQSSAQWIIRYTDGSGYNINQFGATYLSDIPVSGDFDGTGKVEEGVFRPSTGQWFINSPSGLKIISFGGGNLLDIPVPGDYDGVGYTELAVFRPSTAQWFVLGPNGGHLLGTFGATGGIDMPAPGDYDGSGKTEMGVFRVSTAQWFYQSAAGGKLLGVFGASGGMDTPVPGDYDGVGHTEMAVFRSSTAQWFVNGPNGGYLLGSFGATNYADLPAETAVGFLKKFGYVAQQTGQVLPLLAGLTPTPDETSPVGPTTQHRFHPSQALARRRLAFFVHREGVIAKHVRVLTDAPRFQRPWLVQFWTKRIKVVETFESRWKPLADR